MFQNIFTIIFYSSTIALYCLSLSNTAWYSSQTAPLKYSSTLFVGCYELLGVQKCSRRIVFGDKSLILWIQACYCFAGFFLLASFVTTLTLLREKGRLASLIFQLLTTLLMVASVMSYFVMMNLRRSYSFSNKIEFSEKLIEAMPTEVIPYIGRGCYQALLASFSSLVTTFLLLGHCCSD